MSRTAVDVTRTQSGVGSPLRRHTPFMTALSHANAEATLSGPV